MYLNATFSGAPGRQQPLRTHKIDEIIITNVAVILKLLNLRPAASVMNLNPRVLHMYFEFIMYSMVNYTTLLFRPQNAMEEAGLAL